MSIDFRDSNELHTPLAPLKLQSSTRDKVLSGAGRTRRRSTNGSLSPYRESLRHRFYARPSSHITTSSVGTSKNPAKPRHITHLASYLETPWWTPEASNVMSSSLEHLERDTFINHTEQALDAARAAETSLKSAEIHLENLVTEGELNIKVLKNEIEVVKTKGQAARHQIATLRATLQSEGVTPKLPPPLGGRDRVHDHSSPVSTDRGLYSGSEDANDDMYLDGMGEEKDTMQEGLENQVLTV